MKLIIDIPDGDYEFIKDLQCVVLTRGNTKTIQKHVIDAIKQGKIYEEKQNKWKIILSIFDKQRTKTLRQLQRRYERRGMSNTYTRIQYKKCKAFNDGKGGRMTRERNKNNQVVTCCWGATTEPTEWGSICEECKSCPKWINNVIGGMDND